jgi:hypothetical protein
VLESVKETAELPVSAAEMEDEEAASAEIARTEPRKAKLCRGVRGGLRPVGSTYLAIRFGVETIAVSDGGDASPVGG